MDLGFQDKSVVVTGGGSNIGRAIVLALAGEGARVTVGDIDAAQAQGVADEANKKGPGHVDVVQTDVLELEQVQNLVNAAVTKNGTVDLLVNNVGWDIPMYFTQTEPDFWEKVIRINYMGVLNCTKTVLDVMIPNQKGAIVSISSDASRMGEAREAVYGGMKAAVNAFMKSIAKENGRYGIRCNVVCPGLTIPDTAEEIGGLSMWTNKDAMFTPEQLEKAAKALPLKRLAKPGEIANAVLFLGSDAAAGYVTGQVLSVSGGYTMIG